MERRRRRREIFLVGILFCFLLGAPVYSQTNSNKFRLFTSQDKGVEVGALTVTSWGTGVLQSDFGSIPLASLTPESAAKLWGKPVVTEKNRNFEQETFNLWGYKGDGQEPQRYQIAVRFIRGKLCNYQVKGAALTRSMWMTPDEDKVGRRHGPTN